jgi:GNAT superfamily N-acetyltransferase
MSVTVWHLELNDRVGFQPSTQVPRYRLERLTALSAAFLRFLYEVTGADWHWIDRIPWTDAQWLERQAMAGVEFWVAYEDGGPIGYFELQHFPEQDTVEIVYFGLLPHAVGKGQGGALLSGAIERAWSVGAKRVYVNTCSLDHPRALDNYQRRGFKVFRVGTRPLND